MLTIIRGRKLRRDRATMVPSTRSTSTAKSPEQVQTANRGPVMTKSTDDLGFYGRTSVGISFELEDDDLERLVGKATHISLRRIGSKGIMRVPSKERFSFVKNCSRANVLSGSGILRSTSQGYLSTSPRMLLSKGSESLKRCSPHAEYSAFEKTFESGITMVDDDGEIDDDSEETKKEIEVFVNGVRNLVRASSRLKMSRALQSE